MSSPPIRACSDCASRRTGSCAFIPTSGGGAIRRLLSFAPRTNITAGPARIQEYLRVIDPHIASTRTNICSANHGLQAPCLDSSDVTSALRGWALGMAETPERTAKAPSAQAAAALRRSMPGSSARCCRWRRRSCSSCGTIGATKAISRICGRMFIVRVYEAAREAIPASGQAVRVHDRAQSAHQSRAARDRSFPSRRWPISMRWRSRRSIRRGRTAACIARDELRRCRRARPIAAALPRSRCAAADRGLDAARNRARAWASRKTQCTRASQSKACARLADIFTASHRISEAS